MKKFIKKLGQMPTMIWALIMMGGNIASVAIFNSIPVIIGFNAVWIAVGLLAVFSRFIK